MKRPRGTGDPRPSQRVSGRGTYRTRLSKSVSFKSANCAALADQQQDHGGQHHHKSSQRSREQRAFHSVHVPSLHPSTIYTSARTEARISACESETVAIVAAAQTAAMDGGGKGDRTGSSRRELIQVVDAHPLFQLRNPRRHFLKTVLAEQFVFLVLGFFCQASSGGQRVNSISADAFHPRGRDRRNWLLGDPIPNSISGFIERFENLGHGLARYFVFRDFWRVGRRPRKFHTRRISTFR